MNVKLHRILVPNSEEGKIKVASSSLLQPKVEKVAEESLVPQIPLEELSSLQHAGSGN